MTKNRPLTYIIKEERKNISDIDLLIDFKKEADFYMPQYIFSQILRRR
jgi:predicted nucleotidyltransferase